MLQYYLQFRSVGPRYHVTSTNIFPDARYTRLGFLIEVRLHNLISSCTSYVYTYEYFHTRNKYVMYTFSHTHYGRFDNPDINATTISIVSIPLTYLYKIETHLGEYEVTRESDLRPVSTQLHY